MTPARACGAVAAAPPSILDEGIRFRRKSNTYYKAAYAPDGAQI